jgi:hypothetical protein
MSSQFKKKKKREDVSFFEIRTTETEKTNGTERVLNKGRALGFPPYGGKPFRLY